MTQSYAPGNFGLAGARAQPAPELSIIVPTYCEAENIVPLIGALSAALHGVDWEVIFVDDDSPDRTADIIRALGQRDSCIRGIRRVGRRGLAGASIEGMLSSSAEVVAVMDCDLQHDETALPKMLAQIRNGADLVVATRYRGGGTAGGGLSAWRQRASKAATRLTHGLLKTDVSDPMSGFFMIRRQGLDNIAPRLSTDGFKILLDILASRPAGLKIAEVPYAFRPRQNGQSKLSERIIVEFLSLLAAKALGNWISPRFVLFSLVGASGVAIHLMALNLVPAITAISFNGAQIAASYIAMTWNFYLNNAMTYRDRRLTGFAAIKGLLSFYLVCSVGTLANVGVAQLVYGHDASWWRAGLAGALMAAVFNYAASSALTWRRP
jgi:dolichol-phosphate mannosyltransferase